MPMPFLDSKLSFKSKDSLCSSVVPNCSYGGTHFNLEILTTTLVVEESRYVDN